jgi:outer membrane protein assembly factor BamB
MTPLRFGSFVLGMSVGLWPVPPGLGARVPAPKERMTPFVQWAVSEDFDSNDPHDPLVVKGKVVVGTDKGELRAYRCQDGKSAWTYVDGARIFHRPCSDGEHVYFTSANGLTAVTTESGEKVWRFGLACCDGPTIVLGKRGMVFVGGHDGNLYAIDTKTGKQVWMSDFLTEAPPDRPNFPGQRARVTNTKARPSDLASDGETLFLSVFDQSRVVAVNATSGKQLWSFQAGGWVYGSAVASDRYVFFGSQDKSFYCLDKQTGKHVWKHETKGRVDSGGALDKECVYFGSCDGGLYCLNRSDGKKRWGFATDRRHGRNSAIYSVPVLQGSGVCFAAGEGQAYGVDRDTGALKWKIRPSDGSELFCSPATDGKCFFLVTRARDKEPGRPALVAIGLK